MSARAIVDKTCYDILTKPFESLCDSFFVFYSLWTLTWIVAYRLNLSLSALYPIFFLLIPASLLVLAFKRSETGERAPNAGRRVDAVIVLVFVIVGILLTLFLHRPDADDELYLGMALSLLANADQPLQQLPYALSANDFTAIAAYEPLTAMISYITGLPLLDSYYLLVPALMSALMVIVTYRLLRELVPEGWILGMLFFFVVMLTWGDVHRTLANFGFVRMFQGKSVLVSAVVPALFLYFFLLRDRSQARYYSLLLAAAVISGVGFSRGGLIIGPLVLAFLALASTNFRALGKLSKCVFIITGILAGTSLLFAYHYGWTLMNPSHLVYTANGRNLTTSTTNLEMIELSMGHGIRTIFLLTCVGASFWFVKDKELRHSYKNFLAIFFVLLLIPWTSNFFARTIQEYLSWRWMWIAPVPVLASVAVGGALTRIRQASNYAVALGVFLVVAFGFAAASPRRVLSQENYTSVRWPGAKLDGNSIYLKPYHKTAKIKDGKLYLDNYERGF